MLIDRTQANTEKFPTCQKKMDSAKQNEAEGRKGEEGVLHRVCLPDSKLNKRISCKAVKTLHTAFRLNTVTKPWCGTHTLLMNEKHLIH